MKETFLGTVYTKANKDHVCYTCWKTINPDFLHKTRHDVWKEWKTVVNKYFCKTCEELMDNQLMLKSEDWKPYNPKYWEFTTRFPHVYNPYFKEKYTTVADRIGIISDLQLVFGLWLFAKIQYFIAHRLFWAKHFNGYKYRFDARDYREFAKSFENTKNHAFYLFDNAE